METIVTNKERKPNDMHLESEFGKNAKAIEELTKNIDWKHLSRVGMIMYAVFLFIVFTFIVTIRAAITLF